MDVSTVLIKPTVGDRLTIRCDVGDAMVANLAIHLVFFFERRLDPRALGDSLCLALNAFPAYAGRLVPSPQMAIRVEGQGVPFSCTRSTSSLNDAIRSVSADRGEWLVDPVNGPAARWGVGPLCKVRITDLADSGTAIGFSFHHVVGDMATLMAFLNAWSAATAGRPIDEPVMVEDRAANLRDNLPESTVGTPGVRILGVGELARSAAYLYTQARRQRTVGLYFGDDEIARMRDEYSTRVRLSTNDAVCAHLCEALMRSDADVDRRTLAMPVNMRRRGGLDPALSGNIITTLRVDLRRGEQAPHIAERIRLAVDALTDGSDMRANQEFLDRATDWQAARLVSVAYDPRRWNPLITNLNGFGVYRIEFDGARVFCCTFVMKLPVPGLGSLLEGVSGRGIAFQMALPRKEFDMMSRPQERERLHRFRRAGDDIPRLYDRA